jgi:indolepyruvate ferredoxin oxidoreductase
MTVTASIADFDLDAKYRVTDGRVLITGVQALARVLLDQIRADREQGLRIAAFVSGYPGSPLGGFDQILERNAALLAEHDVRWVPGVNEDLAATAVWGSQQDNLAPLKDRDGVIGMWYGKAPGVDRSGDAFRHANLHGVGTNGGVVCAVGDDPQSKSSTLPSASEVALYDAGMPILVPGTAQEVLDLGRHAYELSRYTGCWTGLKIVTSVADGFGSADVAPGRITPVRPELSFGGEPWRYAQRPSFFLPHTIELEAELYERRHAAARAYAAANGLNAVEVDPAEAWLTILSAGRTYREVRQALADLGLASDAALRDAGIRLVRLGMIYPLEPGIARAAARGVEEILVVEEKRSFVERFLREYLYDQAERPRVVGKRDERDAPLIPADGELNADRLRPLLARGLERRLGTKLGVTGGRPQLTLLPAGTARTAAFCSGCPHSRSTVPGAGSPVGAGVGCHAMVMWLDRGAVSYNQMGGEGAQWIGRAPFTEVPHFVQNVGDGTFFHSGSLAVRAAVSAGVTMTFKVLYNGVVAMTGGQDPAGQLDVPHLCQAMAAEGVARIIVVSEDPSRYRRPAGLPPGTRVWPRDRLAEAERVLAGIPGVTLLVYDQACAAELRRLRKRGKAPERPQRVVINEAVCEGCGDCGVKSNCLSVHPVDTELGRKTQIDQASCNTDYGCLDGDCPSFVTVLTSGGRPPQTPPRAPAHLPVPLHGQPPAGRRGRRRLTPAPSPSASQVHIPADVPEPEHKAGIDAARGYGIVATGIGGTGVVLLNQVLATAAFLDGLQVTGLDQTGLSQKAGPVVSHLRLWRGAEEAPDLAASSASGAPHAGSSAAHAGSSAPHAGSSAPHAGSSAPHAAASNAVGEESADLLLALDLLVAADPRHLARAAAGRTVTVASTSLVPTADMVRGAAGVPDVAALLATVQDRTRPGGLTSLDTIMLATTLFGDGIAANLIALGAAYQAGAVPLQASSIARAIELNGVAVERNLAAFGAGRLAVCDPGALPAPRRVGELRRDAAPQRMAVARELAAQRGLDGSAAERAIGLAADLIAYQNARLAGRYLDLVAAAAQAESSCALADDAGTLTEAVAAAFFHLLAYKDEYEVARLHLLPEFDRALAEAVPGGHGVRYRLHPPLLRAVGLRKKIAFPAPVIRPAFRVLRAMRHVRGTPADVFGHTAVRRTERRLAAGYEAEVRAMLAGLSAANHAAAVELARLPLTIRGYEQIKLAAVERYEADLERLRPLAR